MVGDRYREMVGDRIDGDAFSQGEKRILRLNWELMSKMVLTQLGDLGLW
jgi:hypothetical protein